MFKIAFQLDSTFKEKETTTAIKIQLRIYEYFNTVSAQKSCARNEEDTHGKRGRSVLCLN